MLLTKLTRGNQVTIPKVIVEKAGFKKGEDFFYVEYTNGSIILKPIDIEERIPPETFERFIKKNLKTEKEDVLLKPDKSNKFLENWIKKR